MSFKQALEFHNRAIDKLITQVEQQKDLLAVVQNVLPQELASHTLQCTIHGETLFLYTDAAVWSSQLRFYQAVILTAAMSLVQQEMRWLKIRLFTQK